MTDWVLFALIFWGAFVFDALRRLRRARHAVHGAFLAGRGWWHFDELHLIPLLPWQWRFWTDDPTLSFSPHGILNQPAGSSGRPTESPPHALMWRWEEITACTEQGGWLLVNERRFAPSCAAMRPARLQQLAQQLAPLAPAAREAKLQRELHLWFRPAHWRRRLRVVKARTRFAAALNGLTLLGIAALTVVAATDGFASRPAFAERVMPWVPHIALVAFALWVASIVEAFLAARKLARWSRPGVRSKIATALLFPPQALRWRTVLSEAVTAAPHPLLLTTPGARRDDARLAAFNAFADLEHPRPLPADAPPEAALIRDWFRVALRPHFERVLRPAESTGVAKRTKKRAKAKKNESGQERKMSPTCEAPLDPRALLAAPKPDGPMSCAYCPRCHDQFVRADAHCPHGIALRKFEAK